MPGNAWVLCSEFLVAIAGERGTSAGVMSMASSLLLAKPAPAKPLLGGLQKRRVSSKLVTMAWRRDNGMEAQSAAGSRLLNFSFAF